MASAQESTHVWTMIYTCLIGDATLIAALGHTSANPHIGRQSQRKHLADPCITFGQQVSGQVVFNDQPRILSLRNIFFQLSAYSENSDVEAMELIDLVLEAIVGEVLSNSGYRTNPIEWDNFTSPPYYDENEEAYRQDTRIKVIVKECSS